MSNVKIFTDNIEPKALEQVYTLTKQDAFANCKVRIMPDVHAGAGCVIGFTANLGDKVIPNIVGVDIGCGMLTVELGNIDLDLEALDNFINANIASGFHVRQKVTYEFDLTELRCYNKLENVPRLAQSLGTLGGGNHFIEIDVDSNGNKYLIIHTGSRNLGKQVALLYQNKAIHNIKQLLPQRKKELAQQYKAEGREHEIADALAQLPTPKIPKELCYLEGADRDDYLHDMEICQAWASINRHLIARDICAHLGFVYYTLPNFETIHNYINFNDNITRKGAISAQKGEKVLIPLNMRDGCILGVGRGNEDWNCSAPHGAGRLYSRGTAKQILTMEEFESSMEGIYTTSVNSSTLDESAMAYKPANEILDKVGDTVDIIDILKPIYNFKAH